MKYNNECYLGNPMPGEVDGDFGTADLWISNFKVQKQSKHIKNNNKYKNKKVKMKNLNDKKVLNALIEKYSVNGVLNAIDKLTESLYYDENGYTTAMVQSLIDDGHIEEDATQDDIYEFINDRCMAFWATDEEDLAKQYVDQMINYKEYDTLADFINRYDCFDYAALGYYFKSKDLISHEDFKVYKMSHYAAGVWIFDNYYEGNLEYMIKSLSKDAPHNLPYINFREAGENILKDYSYTTGIDEEGNNFYILIFY